MGVLTNTATLSSNLPLTATVAGVATASQTTVETLAWTLQSTTTDPLNWGALIHYRQWCDREYLLIPPPTDAPLRVLVDVNTTSNPAVSTVASDGSVDLATLSQALAIGTGLAGGQYALVGAIQHDDQCPGSYIMGQVLNREGSPVAGNSD